MIKSNHLDHLLPSSNPSQTTRLSSLQKKQQSLWQTIRQTISDAKKQFKKLNEQTKQELSTSLSNRAQVIEQILRTLDSKIQFVIGSCQKYGMRIMQHVLDKWIIVVDNNKNNMINQENQKHIQIMIQRMKVLEQKFYSFHENQKQLKRIIQSLKQKNYQLQENIRIITLRSNKQIEELRIKIQQKENQFRNKEIQIMGSIKKYSNQNIQSIQKQISKNNTQYQQTLNKSKSKQNYLTNNNKYCDKLQQIKQYKKQYSQKLIQLPSDLKKLVQPLINNNNKQQHMQKTKAGDYNLSSKNQINTNNNNRNYQNRNIRQFQYHQRQRQQQQIQRNDRSQNYERRFQFLMSNLVGTEVGSNASIRDESGIISEISSIQSSYVYR